MQADGPGIIASVVTATRNRAHLLPRLCTAIENQTVAPSIELIVVDDASTDDTSSALAEIQGSSRIRVSAMRLARRSGPAAARNLGWRAARGEYVLFTDDDCEPRPEWAENLLDALAESDVVQGTTIPARDQLMNNGPFSRTLEVVEPSGFFQTCNMGYRRKLLEVADGFDEAFQHPAGEDTDLALRCLDLGARFVFKGAAVVEHDVRPSSLRSAIRDSWRWQGVVGAVAKHPELRVRHGSRLFWKPSHRVVLLALGGIGLALLVRRDKATAVGATLVLPYMRYRLRIAPVHPSWTGRVKYLGHAFVVDTVELAALARGSIRYRTLFL